MNNHTASLMLRYQMQNLFSHLESQFGKQLSKHLKLQLSNQLRNPLHVFTFANEQVEYSPEIR